jgi:REP element-mobilizing transposase RayT
LSKYDYSQPGEYFVTICTKDREGRFGEIVDGDMRMNDFGGIAQSRWNDLPNHYPNVKLDAFVVMPNHVHGIIVLTDESVGARSRRPNTGAGKPRPYLGNVVAYLKYQSAKRINAIRGTPGVPIWQRGYYDHIIRDQRSLERIREYIVTNPCRWKSDKENPASTSKDEFDLWVSSAGGDNTPEGAL